MQLGYHRARRYSFRASIEGFVFVKYVAPMPSPERDSFGMRRTGQS